MRSEDINSLIEKLKESLEKDWRTFNWRLAEETAKELKRRAKEPRAKRALESLQDIVANFVNYSDYGTAAVRISALEAIVEIQDDKDALVEELIQWLTDNSVSQVRQKAADELKKLGSRAREAIFILQYRALTEGEQCDVRCTALEAVAKIESKNASGIVISILEKFQKSNNAEMRHCAFKALNFIDNTGAKEKLANLKEQDAIVKKLNDTIINDEILSQVNNYLQLLDLEEREDKWDYKSTIISVLGELGKAANADLYHKLENIVSSKTKNEAVRQNALEAIIKIYEGGQDLQRLIDDLIKFLENDQWAIRRRAAQELEILGLEEGFKNKISESLKKLYQQYFNENEDKVRTSILAAIVTIRKDYLKDEIFISHLGEKLNKDDDRDEIVLEIVQELGKHKPGSIKSEIIENLKKKLKKTNDDHLCAEILAVIDKHEQNHEYIQNYFKSSPLIKNFIENLRNDDWQIRQKAAQGLGKLGSAAQNAVLELKRCVSEDSDIDVCSSALEAIVNISENQDAKGELVLWLSNNLKHDKWKIRQEAAQGLGKLGSAAQNAVLELKQCASEDSDSDVRHSALEAIVNISENQDAKADLVSWLIENLKHESWEVRQEAAQGLGKLGSAAQNAVPELKLRASEDSDVDVRYSALEAIVNISENQDTKADLVRLLIENLKHESLEVRQEAAQKLGKVGSTKQQDLPELRSIFLESDKREIVKGILDTILKVYNNEKSALAHQLTELLCFKDWKYRSKVSDSDPEKAKIAKEWLTSQDEYSLYSPFLLRSMLLRTDSKNEASKKPIFETKIIQELLKTGSVLENDSLYLKKLLILLSGSITDAKDDPSSYSNILLDKAIQTSSINAIKALMIKIDNKKIYEECIYLLRKSYENENEKPFIIATDFFKNLNEYSPDFLVNKNIYIQELWNFIEKFSSSEKEKINNYDWQAFETIYELTEPDNKSEIVQKLIEEIKIPEVKRYCFILMRDDNEKLRDELDEQWKVDNKAKGKISKQILELIIKAFNDIKTETKIYGNNRSVSLEASKWLREKIDEEIFIQYYQKIKETAERISNNKESEEIIREKAKQVLKALEKQEEIQKNQNKKQLRERLEIKVKQLSDFDELVETIKEITNLEEEKEAKENISVLVEEWIQWILLSRELLSPLAVQKAADLMRPNAYAILPLVNKFKQFNQEWQPEEEIREIILANIYNKNDYIQRLYEDKNPEDKDKIENSNISEEKDKRENSEILNEKFNDWIGQVKSRSLKWSDEVKKLNDKNIPKKRIVKYLIPLIEKEEVEKLKLSISQKVVQQLAEMSDGRFFSPEESEGGDKNTEKKKLENNKQELLKHGVIVLGRHLPNEENDDIRENIARILGNVGGPFAVDALAQAVVGEERKRKERQNLLAQYYLDPSKTRSEEAAQMLKGAINEAKYTLRIHQILNSLLVVVALVFLITGIILIASSDNNSKRFAGIFTSVGGVGAIVVHFITKPLQRIEKAMANLVQAQTAFTSFIWGLNLNGTYIQSQYVSGGTLTDEAVTQTIDRIENTMKVTMELVATHIEEGERSYIPRIHRLVPSSNDFEQIITIYGQNLKGDPQNKKHTCLVAINHTPIQSIEQANDWSEDQITFKLKLSEPTTQGRVWLSLFVDGLETNVLPFYIKQKSIEEQKEQADILDKILNNPPKVIMDFIQGIRLKTEKPTSESDSLETEATIETDGHSA
ncbi:MAG: HEAT repeat domain-containing protein [Nostoc sp. CreGUA01]